MKPIIILPPEVMSESDIAMLRENGLCVVVSKDPSNVKFVDPIPASSSRTEIENAAIKLSRILLNRQWGHISQATQLDQGDFSRLFVHALINGTPLDGDYVSPEQLKEREKVIFDNAKHDELRRLAREEAKAERLAAKAAAEKQNQKTK